MIEWGTERKKMIWNHSYFEDRPSRMGYSNENNNLDGYRAL